MEQRQVLLLRLPADAGTHSSSSTYGSQLPDKQDTSVIAHDGAGPIGLAAPEVHSAAAQQPKHMLWEKRIKLKNPK